MKNKRVLTLCEGAVCIALAYALSFFELDLWFQGGSIGVAMLPIVVYAWRRGLGWGVMAGLIFGTIKCFFAGGFAWGWQSILLDYLVAYTALGLGGFFKGKAWGIFPCVAIGSLGRFAVHYLSGVTLYKIIEPTGIEGLEGLGVFTNPHVYSIVYNGVYMLPNMLIAMVIAALLYVPMKKFFAGKDILAR